MILFIVITYLANQWVQAQELVRQSPFPADVKRIAFLGNSITYAGKYITDIEAYFVTRFPNLKIEFINVGLPSETVSGLSEPGHAGGKFPRPDLHERLDRILAQTKPDWVFACYGINDGIYLPLDEERFQKFMDGIKWLHKTVEESGAKIIHLTPSVYDEVTGKHQGYAAVLDIYSRWLIDQAKKDQWQVIDIYNPMKKFLDDQRKEVSTFALAKDGVHPGEQGHWIIARQVLVYLGETEAEHASGIVELLEGDEGEKIFDLISQRQTIMKDSWLTYIGHKRPGMKVGLPIEDAKQKAAEIEKAIILLLK